MISLLSLRYSTFEISSEDDLISCFQDKLSMIDGTIMDLFVFQPFLDLFARFLILELKLSKLCNNSI